MTNDAAERLQQDILNAAISGPDWDWDEAAATKVADQALDAERRATVERCFVEAEAQSWDDDHGNRVVALDALRIGFAAILDAEADR